MKQNALSNKISSNASRCLEIVLLIFSLCLFLIGRIYFPYPLQSHFLVFPMILNRFYFFLFFNCICQSEHFEQLSPLLILLNYFIFNSFINCCDCFFVLKNVFFMRFQSKSLKMYGLTEAIVASLTKKISFISALSIDFQKNHQTQFQIDNQMHFVETLLYQVSS